MFYIKLSLHVDCLHSFDTMHNVFGWLFILILHCLPSASQINLNYSKGTWACPPSNHPAPTRKVATLPAKNILQFTWIQKQLSPFSRFSLTFHIVVFWVVKLRLEILITIYMHRRGIELVTWIYLKLPHHGLCEKMSKTFCCFERNCLRDHHTS